MTTLILHVSVSRVGVTLELTGDTYAVRDALKSRGWRYFTGPDRTHDHGPAHWELDMVGDLAVQGAGDVEVRYLRSLVDHVVGAGRAEQKYLDNLA